MESSWLAFMQSLFMILISEIGDKTQLLTLAFASKYKTSKVFAGVFIGVVLNHGLAVLVGSYLAGMEVIRVWVQVVAAISFIIFGLWTLKPDDCEDGECENGTKSKCPVLTIAAAFFVAELGDKTQLAIIPLSVNFPYHPAFILLGTVSGMMIINTLSITVGAALFKRIPARVVNYIAAGMFMVFGFVSCYSVFRKELALDLGSALAILTVILVITAAALAFMLKKQKSAK